MKTVILCGGFGTRIRDVADDIPKPLIPVAGLPILWHIMKYYAHFNHKDFVLCLGYKGNQIKDFFLNYQTYTSDFTLRLGQGSSATFHTTHEESDWEVTLANTGLNALTGARVKRIQKYVADEENFFLTYGDGVSDIDLDSLLEFHKSHGKVLTMTGVRPPSRWGEVTVDGSNSVIGFNEKPQASGGLINGGFFVCRRELFGWLDDREDLTFEAEPLQNLVKEGELKLYHHEGFWQAMDTHRDYMYLNGIAKTSDAPWIKWEE